MVHTKKGKEEERGEKAEGKEGENNKQKEENNELLLEGLMRPVFNQFI